MLKELQAAHISLTQQAEGLKKINEGFKLQQERSVFDTVVWMSGIFYSFKGGIKHNPILIIIILIIKFIIIFATINIIIINKKFLSNIIVLLFVIIIIIKVRLCFMPPLNEYNYYIMIIT